MMRVWGLLCGGRRFSELIALLPVLLYSQQGTPKGQGNYQIQDLPPRRSQTLTRISINLLLGRLSRASRLLSIATIHVDCHHFGGRSLDTKKAGAAFQVEQSKPLTPTATSLPGSHLTPWVHRCHSHKFNGRPQKP